MSKKARSVRSSFGEKGPHRAGFLQLIFLFLFFLTAVFLHDQVGTFVNVAATQRQNQITGLHAGSSAQGRITASGEFHPAPKTAIDFYDAIIAQHCVFVNKNYGISFPEEEGSTSIATHSGGLQKRGSRFLSSPRLTTMALSPR